MLMSILAKSGFGQKRKRSAEANSPSCWFYIIKAVKSTARLIQMDSLYV